jgi:LasA protease
MINRFVFLGLILALVLGACAPTSVLTTPQPLAPTPEASPVPQPTPLPTRPLYPPGELVDYIAQTGDTLPALAARFNTTVDGILLANPFIPREATTMPPGMPMKIPIYYMALWGSSYQILPDGLYVNGPAQVGFNADEFLSQHPGWLATYREYASGDWRTAGQLADLVALNFSVSPRLLIALVEFHSQGVSNPQRPADMRYPLGYRNVNYQGLYMQMVWAANTLNNGYYAFRGGKLREFEHVDGRLERPDPWQNAATVALHYYFSRFLSRTEFEHAIHATGLQEAYARLFGDPWAQDFSHIPGSLEQPALALPFERGKTWNYTGGPHTGWGRGEPFAAIDFAPVGTSGCNISTEWVTAMAEGVVLRSEGGIVELDLDGDGDLRTGWTLYYLHIAADGRVPVGQVLPVGGRIGYPSCEGGSSTGTHVHIARKFNGEWILADSPVAFVMDGWRVFAGSRAYEGSLKRSTTTVTASDKAEIFSLIKSE